MKQRIKPAPGQESVWDYPRPPRAEPLSQHIRVVFNGEVIADTHRAVRVLETSHPPVYYLPQDDIKMIYLSDSEHTTFCEFKGQAHYWHINVNGKAASNVGWSYPAPTKGFASIKNYIAFYPSQMDACFVNDERVQAQAGDFYGGWITRAIVGPFKGGTGTWGW